MIQGIDLYHGDQLPDLTPVDFVIHKATQGTSFVDPAYASRAALVRATGKIWGAYHFFETSVPVTDQVNHFVRTAALAPGDLAYLDFEDDGTWQAHSDSALAALAHQFMIGLAGQLRRQRQGLYCNLATYVSIVQPFDVPTGALWIAHFGLEPAIPYTIWQHTSTPFDQDYARFGSIAELRRWTNRGHDMSSDSIILPAGSDQFHKLNCPVGSASSLTARAWLSLSCAIETATISGVDQWISSSHTVAHHDGPFTLAPDVRWNTELTDGIDTISVVYNSPVEITATLEIMPK